MTAAYAHARALAYRQVFPEARGSGISMLNRVLLIAVLVAVAVQVLETEALLHRPYASRFRLADILVGNEEDMQLGLGVQGPQVAGASKLDPRAFIGMIDEVVRLYPGIKVVATTLREVYSTNRHSWGAVAWIDGNSYVAPTCELDVYDRVGGGDGCASGLFYGLLSGQSEQEAVNLGWAHGALLTTFPGDTTMSTLEQVRAFARGGSARIQR